jgi:WD40 repeat protein
MLRGGPLKGVPPGGVAAASLPRHFGGYELLEEVARGGMGIVYRARQMQINRLVAVKVMAAGVFAAPDFVARFRTEAEAVASLDHPNIVPIYEVGDVEGQPFFSMRFIEGGSLAQRIAYRESPMPHREAAGLLAKLSHAVHYAHQRGILHRDIKPGNILLDAEGEPHLTDFGLARLVEKDSTLTRTLAMLGTPSYMSPEQARGEARELTTGVDVYGLGAVFYELLTGQPPFAGGTTIETVRQVLEKDPRRPSVVRPGLDRDLETICLKCLEKDPGRRYHSAEALAADLERWQRQEPILARPQSGLYVLGKLVRRNKGGTAALGGVLMLLVAGLVFGWWQAGVQRKLRETAESNERTAREAQARAALQQKKAEAERQRADEQLTRAEWLIYSSKLMMAQTDFETANGALALHYLSECPEKLRGWEWRYLWNRINGRLTLTHAQRIEAVAFSADGRRIVTGSYDKTAKVWDATTGVELLTIKGHKGHISCVAFSPDNQRIVTGASMLATGISPGEAKVWDAATGQQIFDLKGHNYSVWSVAFSPDGRRIVTAAGERLYTAGEAKVWDAATGQELLTLPCHEYVDCVAFSPDGQRIVTGDYRSEVKVWDAATGKALLSLKGHSQMISSVAFSPDGTRIVSSGWDKTAKVWDTATGREITTFQGHANVVASAAFSPDGTRIVTGSWDKTIKIWDAQTAQEIFTLKGHNDYVRAVAFSPDGRRVVTGSEDRTARIWDAEGGQEIPTLKGHRANVSSIAFSADGQRVVTGGQDGTVKVWDRATGREVHSLHFKSGPREVATVWCVAMSPDGRRIVAGGMGKIAKVWDAETGQQLLELEHTNAVLSVAFSPDGTRIVAGVGWWGEPAPRPGEVKIWDAATGQLRLALQHPKPAWGVAFSPDGQRIVTGSALDGEVKLWEAATGREIFARKGHRGGIGGVAFSPDGRRIVTGGYDRRAKVWNADTGQELLVLNGHTGHLLCVAFSPDGQRIVTGSEDRTVKVWEAGTGLEVLSFRGCKTKVLSVAFSPDGETLMTTEGAVAKVWSTGPPP